MVWFNKQRDLTDASGDHLPDKGISINKEESWVDFGIDGKKLYRQDLSEDSKNHNDYRLNLDEDEHTLVLAMKVNYDDHIDDEWWSSKTKVEGKCYIHVNIKEPVVFVPHVQLARDGGFISVNKCYVTIYS